MSDAVERLTTSAGAILVVAMTVVGVVQTAALQDILRAFLESMLDVLDDPEFREELSASDLETLESQIDAALADLPLAMGLSPTAAALVWLLAFVAALVIVAVAIDTFANERDSFDGLETERLGRKTLHLLLGWIAFGVLFVIGLFLFVFPGLLVALFLVFFAAAIVIDDESFVSAFGSSYRVARSNLGGALAVLLLVIVAFIASRFVSGILAGLLSGVPGAVAAELVTSVAQVFVLALVARAYVDATATSEDTTGPVDEDDWASETTTETDW